MQMVSMQKDTMNMHLFHNQCALVVCGDKAQGHENNGNSIVVQESCYVNAECFTGWRVQKGIDFFQLYLLQIQPGTFPKTS